VSPDRSGPADGRLPRRLLLCIDGLGPGGAERQLCLLCEGLAGRIDTAVWSLHGGPLAGRIEALGTKVRTGMREGAGRIAALQDALAYMREFDPDILHSWGWISSFLCEASVRLRGRGTHVTGLVRMGTAPSSKRIRLLMAARLGRLCIGNSAAGLAAWRIPARKARLVPNGFDDRRLLPRTSMPGAGPVFRVVMAGSMSAHKDFDTLVRTARMLEDERPGRFRFLLLGDGPGMEGLASLASDLGCTSVEFGGRVPDIMPLLPGCDAGVLLSPLGEGMSNSLMEYMAAGLPVVCTRGGGNPELVRDGVDGWIVPLRDPRSLLDRLTALADHPGTAAEMGRAARERIISEFPAARMVEAVLGVYREAAGGRG